MNKKLENVLIVDGKANDIISFLELHGGTNQYHKKSNNSKDGYFIDTFGCIIRTIHREFHETILTLEQAKELVNPKPELTFPRKMLVWVNPLVKAERIVVAKINDYFITLSATNEIFRIDPNMVAYNGTYAWPEAQELPTQQEINQEKIETLEKEISLSIASHIQKTANLQQQINQLKSQII